MSDISTDATKLLTLLKEQESKPNILTRKEFEKFQPLFQQHNYIKGSPEYTALVDLSEEYWRRIDPYRITVIIESDTVRKVILTLPRILTSVRQLSHTETNDVAVATNQKMYGSGAPPKYQAQAFGTMAQALLQEQRNNVPVIFHARKETDAIIADFNKKYGKGQIETIVEPASDKGEWEFD